LDDQQIKFTAALHSLGGADSKKNTQAARLAGIDCDRTAAYRMARSVDVRRLLDEADKIKRGARPPLTEAEIDQKIDDLIRAPDALTVARAIELREKRRAVQRDQSSTEEYMNRPDRFIAAWLEAFPEPYNVLVAGLMALWPGKIGLANGHFLVQPLIESLMPHIAAEFSAVWQRLLADFPTNDWDRKWLVDGGAGPRKPIDQIIAEVEKRRAWPAPKPIVPIISREHLNAAG
jgi:hypothetical protein